jgi:hypothetical protein
MGKDRRGKPADSNKQVGLGIKPVISSENLEGSEEMSKKHTKDEDRKVKEKHPNNDQTKGIR